VEGSRTERREIMWNKREKKERVRVHWSERKGEGATTRNPCRPSVRGKGVGRGEVADELS